MKKEKKRLDVLLVEQGFAPSREKAKALIMAGIVYVNQNKEDKAGATFDPQEAQIEVKGNTLRYVSRGGLKLEKALSSFPIDLKGRVCMDIGASTGGFTDCMLQNGAARVYSIDVGYGQLDWKLRSDPRVSVMERTNARYLEPEMFPVRPDITVMDVSFISIRLILPVAARIMGEKGVFYTLIKPQFEAGREYVGKNGVVRDPQTHTDVLNGIVQFAEEIGWRVKAIDYSPITGPKGNIEFLAEIRFRDNTIPLITTDLISSTVENAHKQMNRS